MASTNAAKKFSLIIMLPKSPMYWIDKGFANWVHKFGVLIVWYAFSVLIGTLQFWINFCAVLTGPNAPLFCNMMQCTCNVNCNMK